MGPGAWEFRSCECATAVPFTAFHCLFSQCQFFSSTPHYVSSLLLSAPLSSSRRVRNSLSFRLSLPFVALRRCLPAFSAVRSLTELSIAIADKEKWWPAYERPLGSPKGLGVRGWTNPDGEHFDEVRHCLSLTFHCLFTAFL